MLSFPAKTEPDSREERRILIFSAVMAAVLLILDQLSKAAVVKNFARYESIPLIKNFFSLTYVTNKGAAWSMLEGHIWLLLLTALLVTAAAVIFMRKLADGWTERYMALFLVLSGVAGNSIDRIWRGEVVDFLDVFVVAGGKAYHWPVFNIADCAICIGAGIFFISSVLRAPAEKKSEESA